MAARRFSRDLPYSIPRPPAASPAPGSFTVFPFPVFAASPQQAWFVWCLYQTALEQARAVATPSLPERDLLGVWN